MDERDWRSAKMMMEKIIDDAPSYVKYEAAEAFIADRTPDYALDLYDRLGQTSSRAMQGRIAAYILLESENDIMNAIFDYLDGEYSGTRDYAEMVDTLLRAGLRDEATKVLDRMVLSNKRDPIYLISTSKVLLDKGDILRATRVSREAVHYAKNDPMVCAIAARVKFVAEDVKGAEKDCDKVLATYPKHKEALLLKRDILIQRNDTKELSEICQLILDDDPGDIPTMLDLSGAMSSSGKSNEALSVLRTVLRLDPRTDNVVKVITAMMDSGYYREAMFLCYDVEKSIPPDPMIRRLRGNAEYALGDYLKASVSYAAAAELDPHDPVIWHSKGMAEEARGDLESAEISYNRAVLLDIGESEYWISKAVIQERTGDPYGAIESLNRAIELDPDSVIPMVRKAAILENAGRYKEALYFVDLCTVKSPEDERIALMRVRILRKSGATDEALNRAKVIHGLSKSEDSIIELAACLTVYGKRFEAVRIIEEGLKDYPDSERLKVALDITEGGSGDLEEDNIVHAVISLPEDSKYSEEDAEAAAAIAESLLAMKDYKGAMKSIDRAISIVGETPKYICIKTRILAEMGNTKAASDILVECIKDDEKNPLYHEALGDILMDKSEYRKALREYEKAISNGMVIPLILAKKGEAQHCMGFYDRAIDTYTTAVNRDPDNRDLRMSLAYKMHDRGYLSRCEAQVNEVLNRYPADAEAIVLLARVSMESRKDQGVTDAYKKFKALNVQDEVLVNQMFEILINSGHEQEANSLRKPDESPSEPDTKLKRSVERLLRRAYVSRTSPLDQDFIIQQGFDEQEAVQIAEYIQAPMEYGEIVPGSVEFQHMERLSNEVILKMAWKDVESNAPMPLEKVFVSGNFKDVYDAKRLIAYISKATECTIERDDTLKMVLDRVQGNTIYDIMKSCRVGVYQARQIRQIMGVQ